MIGPACVFVVIVAELARGAFLGLVAGVGVLYLRTWRKTSKAFAGISPH
jgi:hypothetical protein